MQYSISHLLLVSTTTHNCSMMGEYNISVFLVFFISLLAIVLILSKFRVERPVLASVLPEAAMVLGVGMIASFAIHLILDHRRPSNADDDQYQSDDLGALLSFSPEIFFIALLPPIIFNSGTVGTVLNIKTYEGQSLTLKADHCRFFHETKVFLSKFCEHFGVCDPGHIGGGCHNGHFVVHGRACGLEFGIVNGRMHNIRIIDQCNGSRIDLGRVSKIAH